MTVTVYIGMAIGVVDFGTHVERKGSFGLEIRYTKKEARMLSKGIKGNVCCLFVSQ